MFFIGDKVTRKKYNHDVIFRITKIERDICYLSGEDIRLNATAKSDDLRIYEKDTRDSNESFLIPKDDNMIYGKVLHIDGDPKYLEKSLKLYKLNDVPVVGYSFLEKEIPNKITGLLVKHKPDILVITGHDSYKHVNNEEFQNSDNFVKAVQNARIFQPDKDALVIFAGACQSYYEALIESGANFASSPKRVSINVLDPVKIAIMVATKHVGSYLDINEILSVTTNQNSGIGGIDTKGVARRIY
jgi:spore coat assembly protein